MSLTAVRTRARFAGAATALLLAACGPSPQPVPAGTADAHHETGEGHPAPAADAAGPETRLGALAIGAATSRETALAGGTAPGFLSIRNEGGADDRLVSASSPAVQSVEIHEMSMDGGQMRMRALPEGLAIPAGQTVTLAPGGLHLMLIGVQAPLAPGQTVPVELRFERAGTVTVNLAVEARRAP